MLKLNYLFLLILFLYNNSILTANTEEKVTITYTYMGKKHRKKAVTFLGYSKEGDYIVRCEKGKIFNLKKNRIHKKYYQRLKELEPKLSILVDYKKLKLKKRSGDTLIANFPMIQQKYSDVKNGPTCGHIAYARILQAYGKKIPPENIHKYAKTNNTNEQWRAIKRIYNNQFNLEKLHRKINSNEGYMFPDKIPFCSQDFEKFISTIQKNIDLGRPIFWAMITGIEKENGLTTKTRNGHARVIVGYNKFKKIIYYTDGWKGAKPVKSWTYSQAFKVTVYTAVIKCQK